MAAMIHIDKDNPKTLPMVTLIGPLESASQLAPIRPRTLTAFMIAIYQKMSKEL
jgi:hypothetical protein